MIEGHENKNIPVMETTIEGAQKRIASVIDWYASYDEGGISPDLEYIAVFLDSVGDEMAAITSSCNSLHDRYVEAVGEIERLREEREDLLSKLVQANDDATALRQANLNLIHAAHDNR